MSDTIRKTKPIAQRLPDLGRIYIREVRRRALEQATQSDPNDWHTYGYAEGEENG